jgi:polar amino acid transport system substrate-binding protein
MKKRLALILGSIALALFPPVMAQAQSQSMTFVMENFPPYIVDDHGRGAGPFPEVVRAVCDSMKIRCTLRLLPWRRAYAMAEMGSVDGIFVLGRTKERERIFHFSPPVFESSFAIISSNPAFAYSGPQDLRGYTVATYGPSAVSKQMQELAKTVPNMRLMIEIDNPSVLRKLRAGRYGAAAVAVMNREVGLQLIAQENLTGLRLVANYMPISYGIGFSRKRVSEKQAGEFNQALGELTKRGTVKSIADKYGLKAAD